MFEQFFENYFKETNKKITEIKYELTAISHSLNSDPDSVARTIERLTDIIKRLKRN